MKHNQKENPVPIQDLTCGEVRRARDYLTGPPRLLVRDSCLLDRSRVLFELVNAAEKASSREEELEARQLMAEVRRRLHAEIQFSLSKGAVGELTRRMADLEEIEIEVVLLLLLISTGVKLLGLPGFDMDDLSQIMVQAGHQPGDLCAVLNPQGRLVQRHMIHIQETDPLTLSRVGAARDLFDALGHPDGEPPWPCASFEEFLERLAELGRTMWHIAECMREENPVLPTPSLWKRTRLLRQVRTTLAAHPEWPLASVANLEERPLLGLIFLICKDIGHLPCGSDADSGSGLMCGLLTEFDESPPCSTVLGAAGLLRSRGWVRPAMTSGSGASETEASEEALLEAAWELTKEARTHFGIPLRRRYGNSALRMPAFGLEKLVLHEDVLEAIEMSVAQVQHGPKMFDEWGLGKRVGYGRGMTLLFSGPSGVGKTAAAEGIAARLGRPLLEVDAAQIQNFLIGESEKNLARVFREAAQAGAVLFFDEADAFFYDRATAQRGWEASQTSVLLRELERFEGVCVLATNHREHFDPAFERRLTMRVEFRPPSAEMSAEIWRRMLPETLPGAAELDVEALGRLVLTGGQIKNVLLNSARRSLALGKDGITMEEVLRAARREAPAQQDPIGFAGGVVPSLPPVFAGKEAA